MKVHHFPPVEGITEEQKEEFLLAIATTFDSTWLESKSNAEHPLKKLWNREDFLAGLELMCLGDAILKVEKIDKIWLTERVNDIKVSNQNYHGYMFELMCISMLATGGMKVRPSSGNAPGVDAIINFDDGFEVFASIKNHDLSENERFFRERSRSARKKAIDHLRQLGKPAVTVIDAHEYLTKSEWDKVEKTIEKFRSISFHDNLIEAVKGKAWVNIFPLTPFDGYNEFASQYFSDTFLSVSAKHKNEQHNFESKVSKASDNLRKHRSSLENCANVIIMKVHASADINELAKYATELLNNEESLANISGIIFYQTQVVKHGEQTAIAHHTQTALPNGSSLGKHPLNISPLFGVISNAQPRNILTSSNHETIDLSTRYTYQAGDHYYIAKMVNGEMRGNVGYLGPGMHAHAVFEINGVPGIFQGKLPKEETLVVM